jgi:hypothetical protein
MNVINEITESIEVNSDISEVDEPLTKPKRGRPKGVAKEVKVKVNGRKVRSEKQIEAWAKALEKKAEMRATIRLEKDEKMAEIYINKKNRESKQSNVEEDSSSSSSDVTIEESRICKTKAKHKKVIVPAPPKQKVKKVSRKVYYSSSDSDSDSDSDDSTSESESSVEVVRHRTKTKTKKAQVYREQVTGPVSFFV